MFMELTPTDLFDLSEFEYRDVFDGCEYPWEALGRIKDYALSKVVGGVSEDAAVEDGAHVIGPVSIGPGTIVEAGAYVRGPAVIGSECEIRSGAYVRGNALIGDGVVVGNSTELKNTIMLNGAAAPHYNYCGDSILGNDTNLGAGTKLSNYKIGADKQVRVVQRGGSINTGLGKLGAILGDGSATGCNAVLNPGTVLGRSVLVYANAVVSGCVPHNTIVKLRQDWRHVRNVRGRFL